MKQQRSPIVVPPRTRRQAWEQFRLTTAHRTHTRRVGLLIDAGVPADEVAAYCAAWWQRMFPRRRDGSLPRRSTGRTRSSRARARRRAHARTASGSDPPGDDGGPAGPAATDGDREGVGA